MCSLIDKLGLTKPSRRFHHELPKVQGGLSGSQHSFLHLTHPRARRLGFLFKLGCHGQDHAFFSKLASKAKMLSPSHPRAEIPHV